LTQNEGNLLDGHDSSAFLFTYYLTSEDAEEGGNPIGNPENYHAETYPETIYVRMESAENSACFAIESFDLELSDINITQLQKITTCQSDAPIIYLTEAQNQLHLENDQSITGYFTNLSDLDANTDRIEDPEKYNLSQEETTIYIRIDGNQMCYEIYTLPVVLQSCELFIPEGFSPNGDGV